MRIFYFFCFSFLLPAHVLAGNENYNTSARTSAMGGAGLTLCDVWSVNINQAGLALLTRPSAGIFYENKFLLPQTGLAALAAALPTRSGTFGVTITQFGYAKYKEGKYGFAYARLLGKDISAGLQLNYITLSLGDVYGKTQNITAELGFRAKIIDNLYAAAHIYNVSHSKIKSQVIEYIPTIIRAGLEYRFSERALVITEVQHDSRNATLLKAGVEYNTREIFYVRAGLSTNPFSQSFGLGLKHKQLQLDAGFAYHYVLGFTPQISFMYSFDKRLKENPSQPE